MSTRELLNVILSPSASSGLAPRRISARCSQEILRRFTPQNDTENVSFRDGGLLVGAAFPARHASPPGNRLRRSRWRTGKARRAGNLEELVMENQLESDQIPLTLSWLESHSHSLKSIDAGSVGAAFQPRTNKH